MFPTQHASQASIRHTLQILPWASFADISRRLDGHWCAWRRHDYVLAAWAPTKNLHNFPHQVPHSSVSSDFREMPTPSIFSKHLRFQINMHCWPGAFVFWGLATNGLWPKMHVQKSKQTRTRSVPAVHARKNSFEPALSRMKVLHQSDHEKPSMLFINTFLGISRLCQSANDL